MLVRYAEIRKDSRLLFHSSKVRLKEKADEEFAGYLATEGQASNSRELHARQGLLLQSGRTHYLPPLGFLGGPAFPGILPAGEGDPLVGIGRHRMAGLRGL